LKERDFPAAPLIEGDMTAGEMIAREMIAPEISGAFAVLLMNSLLGGAALPALR